MLRLAVAAMLSFTVGCRGASTENAGTSSREPGSSAGAVTPSPSPSSSSSQAGDPPPGPTSVKAFISETIEYRWAIAVPHRDGIQVRLMSAPSETCTSYANPKYESELRAPSRGHRLWFLLGRGPGDRFFTGQRVGVSVWNQSHAQTPLTQLVLGRERSEASVESFPLVKGARLRGTIVFSANTATAGLVRGDGTFDAELCDLPTMTTPLPEDVPKTDVAGRLGLLPFKLQSALAMVERGEDGYVRKIVLSSKPGLTCDLTMKYDSLEKFDAVTLDALGGVAKARPILKLPQPATLTVFSTDRSARWFSPLGRTWVRFESIAFGEGDKIVGSIHASTGPEAVPEGKGEIAGRFVATVCK